MKKIATISFCIVIIILFTIFLIGNKYRYGYLSDLELDIYKTLDINNIEYYKFSDSNLLLDANNCILDKDYILTNNSIKKYVYNFKINYYSKIFRHSDILGVYLDTNQLLHNYSHILDVNMNNSGSPYGYFISDKILYEIYKIDNVLYKLKIKQYIYIIIFILFFILFIFNFRIKKLFIILSIFYICAILLSTIILNKDSSLYISDFYLNTYRTMKLNNIDYVNNSDYSKNIYKYVINKTNEYTNQYDFLLYILNTNFVTNYSYSFSHNKDVYNYSLLKKFYYFDFNEYAKDKLNFIWNYFISDSKISFNNKLIGIKSFYYLDNIFYYIGFILFLILFIIFINRFVHNDIYFLYFTVIITMLMFIFHYWFSYPGDYRYGDSIIIMAGDFTNANPIIISVFLHTLYKLFGANSYYILLLNLLLWYSSIILLVYSLYKKYNSKYTIIILFVSYISNIFFMNFNHLKDSTSSLWVFFSYSLFLFLITKDNKNWGFILYFLFFVSLIIGMLWRHNIIVTIYPIFILVVYLILNNYRLSIFMYSIYFLSLMFIFFILLVLLHIFIPKLFIKHDENAFNKTYNINHLFALQIAACATYSSDDSMIPDNWYMPNKTFDDVKKTYNLNPLNADRFSIWWYSDRVFRSDLTTKEVIGVWVKYILKYPGGYIKHILKFNDKFLDLSNRNSIVSHYKTKMHFFGYDSFFQNFDVLEFTGIRESIYNFLYLLLPNIKIKYFVLVSFLIFISSFILLFTYKYIDKSLILFSLSTSLSSLFTYLIVICFTPVIDYRYIYPVVPISIISFISFIFLLYYSILNDIIKNKIIICFSKILKDCS